MNTYDYLCYNCGHLYKIEFGKKMACPNCIKLNKSKYKDTNSIDKHAERLKYMEEYGI